MKTQSRGLVVDRSFVTVADSCFLSFGICWCYGWNVAIRSVFDNDRLLEDQREAGGARRGAGSKLRIGYLAQAVAGYIWHIAKYALGCCCSTVVSIVFCSDY